LIPLTFSLWCLTLNRSFLFYRQKLSVVNLLLRGEFVSLRDRTLNHMHNTSSVSQPLTLSYTFGNFVNWSVTLSHSLGVTISYFFHCFSLHLSWFLYDIVWFYHLGSWKV
jgi:hypothetical protein